MREQIERSRMGRFSGMRFLIILEVQHLESRKLQALKSPGHRLRKPTTCGLAIAIATVLCETSSSKVHEVRLAPLERYAATPEIISQSAVLFVSQSPLQSFCASVHPAKPISFFFAGFAGDRLRGALAHAGDLGAIRYFEFAVSQKQSASMKAANTL